MKKTLIALALAAAPFASFASESNGIGYTNVQLDGVYEDSAGFYGKGAGISGSYAFTDNFFVTGSYSRTRDSDSWQSGKWYDRERLTNKNWTLGVGFNTSIGTRADWVSQLAYARHGVSSNYKSCYANTCYADNDSDHVSGYNLSTGVRGRVTDQLTANAYLGYEDYSHHYDGNFYADFDMGYSFNKTWSIETGVRLAEGMETWNLGARASF
ncbi:outer membrane beta-barrel protein [Lysobacter sp. LF1]|uniref:Outer membrane beta-barrel protein n=1 Tax=Lysobacter stagni TaxID=3045172 RepID=A0ABT6XFP0_9GAMM|nr:outer membrane beta-barrel protein [Lysobacter sp. LF1]MDI9238959.1 outer membrane beta-barrel protein [Lysobacter sp. LF1]